MGTLNKPHPIPPSSQPEAWDMNIAILSTTLFPLNVSLCQVPRKGAGLFRIDLKHLINPNRFNYFSAYFFLKKL
jgi:hypothetical protein